MCRTWNPILVACLGLGYFFNLYRGKPLVREGGVLIMSHPTPWEFHPVHHPSYIDFYDQVLGTTRDPRRIEQEFEEVRREGYSMCVGELEETLYGASAAVLNERERPVALPRTVSIAMTAVSNETVEGRLAAIRFYPDGSAGDW